MNRIAVYLFHFRSVVFTPFDILAIVLLFVQLFIFRDKVYFVFITVNLVGLTTPLCLT